MTGPESESQPDAPPGSESVTDATPVPGPAPVQPPRTRSAPQTITIPGAWLILAVLFGFHLLESVDRWLLPAVLRHIHEDLILSTAEATWLTTILLVSFALASPVVGYFSDRMSRRRLLAVGVAVWGLATIWTGQPWSYGQLQTARSIAGVGGAVIGVIGLTLLMDAFPRHIRTRILAIYFLAAPIGAGLGLVGGSYFAQVTGWPTPFLITGCFGVFAALAAFLLPDPVRGASEGIDELKLQLHERVGASQEDYFDLMVNSSFTYSVFGLTFASFAIGGLAHWLPAYLAVVKRLSVEQSTNGLFMIRLASAFLGIGLGAVISDRVARINLRALFIVPALAIFLAIPCYLVALTSRNPNVILNSIFLTEFLLWLPTGPCFAIIAGVTMPNMRGTGVAAAFCASQLLGEIWAPSLMGWAVDTFGQLDAMATPFGKILATLGAIPVRRPGRAPENLTAGMFVVIPAMVIAGGVLMAGARHLPREMALMVAKLRAAPTRFLRSQPRAVPSPRR